MRIVLDTNILVRSHAKARGPARELLQLIIGSPRHTLLLSPFLLQELERVFSYERVWASSKLTDEEIAEYLGYLTAKEVSEIVFPAADVLCTLNRHFYSPTVRDYCRERGVLVASDVEVLGMVRG